MKAIKIKLEFMEWNYKKDFRVFFLTTQYVSVPVGLHPMYPERLLFSFELEFEFEFFLPFLAWGL